MTGNSIISIRSKRYSSFLGQFQSDRGWQIRVRPIRPWCGKLLSRRQLIERAERGDIENPPVYKYTAATGPGAEEQSSRESEEKERELQDEPDEKPAEEGRKEGR